MTQSSDCRRRPEGTRRGSRVPARTDRKIPTGARHDARCFWRRNRRANVETIRSLCFNKARQRQRHGGRAGREVLPATWEGKPLKGETPEALPARNKAGRVSGGATRQEVEKACRRCTAGRGKPGAGRFPLPQASKGRETSRGVAVSAAVRRGSHFGVEPKSTRGCEGVSHTRARSGREDLRGRFARPRPEREDSTSKVLPIVSR